MQDLEPKSVSSDSEYSKKKLFEYAKNKNSCLNLD